MVRGKATALTMLRVTRVLNPATYPLG